MSELRPFNEVKLQWLAQLMQDQSLSPRAMQVGAYIVLVHYNQDKRKAWPSFGFIAKALGITKKTVQRAISELKDKWFEITRGNGLNHSTEYAPSQETHSAAQELRQKQAGEKRGNIVPLQKHKGGQNCLKWRSFVSVEGGHNCPPNKEIEKIKEKGADAPDLPYGGQSGSDHAFVEIYSYFNRQWDDMLQKHGFLSLREAFPQIKGETGRMGWILPSKYPPFRPNDRRHFFDEWFPSQRDSA